MTNPAATLTHLIIEIQTKANEIAEASRSTLPEGGQSDPNLNLERLIQQAEADAEIAGYCTTEKSRQNRRDALVRSAASSLLALFVMDREEECGADGSGMGVGKCDLPKGHAGQHESQGVDPSDPGDRWFWD